MQGRCHAKKKECSSPTNSSIKAEKVLPSKKSCKVLAQNRDQVSVGKESLEERF